MEASDYTGDNLFNLLKPKIVNPEIAKLVQSLNGVRSFQDPILHEKGFVNQLALIQIKRCILMVYEEEQDINSCKAFVKHLNRFLRFQGKLALITLEEAIKASSDTNHFFHIPDSEEVFDLKKIHIGLHLKHPMHLKETKTIYAKLFVVRMVEMFGLDGATEITHHIKNKKDKDVFLRRLADVNKRIKSHKDFSFGSEFLPIKDNTNSRACEKVLSEAPTEMKALFPLTQPYFDYTDDRPFLLSQMHC